MNTQYRRQPFFFLGLGALAAIGLAPNVGAQQTQGSSAADSLVEQLSERGWQSTPDADGSVTLTPGSGPAAGTVDGAVITPETPAAITPANSADTADDSGANAPVEAESPPVASPPVSGLGEQLKAKLTAAGWRTHTEADGTVTLTQSVDEVVMVEVSKANDTPNKPAPAAVEPPTLATDLVASLGAAGWVTRAEADGSVILTQPVAESSAADVQEAPATEVQEVAANDITPPPVATEPPSLAADLKARLGAAGWVTRTEADGSVVLTQPIAESPAADVHEAPVTDVQEAAADESTVPAVVAEPPTLAADLEARVKAAGWVTRTEADGSVILTQPVAEPLAAVPMDAFSVCTGQSPRDNGDLPAAPIDTWAKARKVARAWRDQHLPNSVVVGLIRDLPHLYIASLVNNDEGRELQHLLAIRKRNGEVLVID